VNIIMTNNLQKKGMTPLAAGVTGFVAGVAGTAAVLLSDENTRKTVSKKAQHVTKNLKKWSEDLTQDLSTKKDKVKEHVQEAAEDIQDKSTATTKHE
jgi:hypothetical protein